ncbi:MAG: cbb3-type cytochrome c oxidase subunit 3 [Weeksellaceae bacterium]|jgi:cbb3-type cytochrome oxidase subunit 3|nr:cbb3-type cytochrome c oxidase subunit 3 [Weeksellaceae bacterium]
MIPQSLRDIMANGDNAGLLQIISLLILLIFFVGLVIYVFSRPKKHYREEENAPLDDDQPFNSNN